MIELIQAKPWHCGQIVRKLRIEHRDALARVGRDAHRELRNIFDQSAFSRALVINGDLAAVGGVTGTMLESTGYAWIAISQETTKYPVSLLRVVRRQLDEAMMSRHELATTIIGGDEAAKRFAVFLGFHVEDEGLGAPAVTRLGRNSLSRHLDTNADLRAPIGNGYVIAMGYHHDGVN